MKNADTIKLEGVLEKINKEILGPLGFKANRLSIANVTSIDNSEKEYKANWTYNENDFIEDGETGSGYQKWKYNDKEV